MSTDAVTAAAEAVRLVDHHVHGVLTAQPDDHQFCAMITESGVAPQDIDDGFRSQLGLAIRRWCAPVLGLPALCSPQTYLSRRAELGNDAVNEILLGAAGVDAFLVDTGHGASRVCSPPSMAQLSGGAAEEIVRLESVLESVASAHVDAASFAEEFRSSLHAATSAAVGLKSIAAYRFGLDFEPHRPSDAEVTAAASAWLGAIDETSPVRVTDPVLLRFAIWSGIDTGLPLQFHTGFGDPDLALRRANPLLLKEFLDLLRGTNAKVMLLHCYPFHREAGYLAHAYPSVYMDVGLAINYLGVNSDRLIAESLELAPFTKVLYSSDGWGPAELHFLGARLWRTGLAGVLGRWVDENACTPGDAEDIVRRIGRENAIRAYQLDLAL